MSLTALPVEVLEILFYYVGVENLLTIWDIVNLEGSDSFWRKICKREGYKRLSEEDGCWKTVFRLNRSRRKWHTTGYVKREYKFDTYVSDSFENDLGMSIKESLQGENLILRSGEKEISAWNIDKSPLLIKRFPAQYYKSSGSKLLTHNIPQAKIHSCGDKSYTDILTLPSNLTRNFDLCYSLTNEYFAALDESLASIKVVNLSNLEEFNLLVSPKKVRTMSIVVLGNILNIMVLDGAQYDLRRYNINKLEWLEDLLLFQGASLIGVPKLKIGSNIIVSWSSALHRDGITPLKVWQSSGKFLDSLPLPTYMSTHYEHQESKTAQQTFWVIVEGDYIIYSIYTDSVYVWNTKYPGVFKEMKTTDADYLIGQNVISSSLLVLSYTYGFTVFNFQSRVCLYSVFFGYSLLNKPLFNMSVPYLINDYFYIYFKECDGAEDYETKYNDVACFSRDSPEVNEKVCLGKDKKTYILTIHDFRENKNY